MGFWYYAERNKIQKRPKNETYTNKKYFLKHLQNKNSNKITFEDDFTFLSYF